MSMDPYLNCPCGSGKKLKFCCQDLADDMEKVQRLLESRQPRAALQHLEQLHRRRPNHSWVTVTRAMLLINEGELLTARDILRSFVEQHPESEMALVFLAQATLAVDGFAAAEKLLQRAFQKVGRKLPAATSNLALTVAADLSSRQQFMVAREYTALALRLAPEQGRQEVFMRLLELDGSNEFPHLQRGPHPLPHPELPEQELTEYKKGVKYCNIGCFRAAADLLQGMANENSPAEVWHALGIAQIWAQDAGAPAALHQAARKYQDLAAAVECEALAQLLEVWNLSNLSKAEIRKADIPQLSRVLSLLDAGHALIERHHLSSGMHESVVASYRLLDRPDPVTQNQPVTLDSAPRITGRLLFFDADAGRSAQLMLLSVSDASQSNLELVKGVLGEHVAWQTSGDETVPGVPAEIESLELEASIKLPRTFRSQQLRELREEQFRRFLNDKWLNTPRPALGGKSPRDCIGKPEYRTALYGAVYALEANCALIAPWIDLSTLLAAVQLEPLPVLKVGPEQSINPLSALQMERLDLESLSDEQLVLVVNRAMISRHQSYLRRLLPAALERPGCRSHLDFDQIVMSLVAALKGAGLAHEALHWLQRGRQWAAEAGNDFVSLVEWEFREIVLLLEEGSTPETTERLRRFVAQYSVKLPGIRQALEPILKEYEIPSPWNEGVILMPGGPETSVTWQQPATVGAESSTGKLWLPGQ